jgi:glyoxylate carboligase
VPGEHRKDTKPACTSTQNGSPQGVAARPEQHGANQPDISFDISKQFKNTSHAFSQIPVTSTLETWNNMPSHHSPFSGMGPVFDMDRHFNNSSVGLHKLDTAITATPAFASTQNVSLQGVGQHGVNHPDISFDINKQFNNTSHDLYQIPVTPTLETWNNMPSHHSPFSGMGPGFDMHHSRHW